MSFLLIFIMTFIITSRVDMIYENLTGVAQLPQYRIIVIIYTLICSLFFAYHVIKVYNYLPIRHIRYKIWIIITSLVMMCGSFFPYTINQHDISSTLHVLCSMFGCLSFLVLLWIYTRKLSIHYVDVYIKIHFIFDIPLQFLIIITLVFARINGVIELLFTGIVCIYLWLIEKNLKSR
jgi:hypothetical protein